MTHEVFISYSHHDKLIADGVCANLESAGIRCWIAPRDIAPGYDWPTAISEAIDQSRILVLIFSSRSNSSKDVSRELILAANNNCIIVPFKIEDVPPEPGKKYYLARTHWLDAMDPPTQEQVDKLVSCVRTFLVDAGVIFPGKPVEKQPPVTEVIQPAPGAQRGGSVPADRVEIIQPPPPVTQQRKVVEEQLPTEPPVSPPTRTSPVMQANQPTRRSRARLGLGLGIGIPLFILLLGFILIWQDILHVPELASIFSNPSPTPTSTRTKIPTATPTRELTKTSSPTPTAPPWVMAFSGPILSIIDKRESDFEAQQIVDYRDWLEADCSPPDIDMADTSNAIFAQDCYFSWKSWFTNFVLKMTVRMESVSSRDMFSCWRFFYCGRYGFSFCYDGTIKDNTAGTIVTQNALLPGTVENQITLIVKDQQHAFIVNDQPVFYGSLPSGTKNGIGAWSVNDPVTFLYLEIWDISSIP